MSLKDNPTRIAMSLFMLGHVNAGAVLLAEQTSIAQQVELAVVDRWPAIVSIFSACNIDWQQVFPEGSDTTSTSEASAESTCAPPFDETSWSTVMTAERVCALLFSDAAWSAIMTLSRSHFWQAILLARVCDLAAAQIHAGAEPWPLPINVGLVYRAAVSLCEEHAPPDFDWQSLASTTTPPNNITDPYSPIICKKWTGAGWELRVNPIFACQHISLVFSLKALMQMLLNGQMTEEELGLGFFCLPAGSNPSARLSASQSSDHREKYFGALICLAFRAAERTGRSLFLSGDRWADKLAIDNMLQTHGLSSLPVGDGFKPADLSGTVLARTLPYRLV